MRTVIPFVRWGFTPTAIGKDIEAIAWTNAHSYGHPIRTVGDYSHR